MKLKQPLFWKNINFISLLLYPISLTVSFINYLKTLQKKTKYNIKTICVGNIYIGGTGKTPLSILINKILKKKYKTVFIKKKYKNQKDEQKLLIKHGNLICDRSRSLCLAKAERKGFGLAIIDDGLQEKSIEYDISIACFNATSKIGNGLLIPAGPLRENLSNLNHYDAVFINGEKKNNKLINKIKYYNNKIKLFQSEYKINNLNRFDRSKKFLAFSGIGSPWEFKNTLIKNKFKIEDYLTFPDHYNYSKKDIRKIRNRAKKKGLKIITTEKDYLRLNKNNKKNIYFASIDLKIVNQSSFNKFLIKKL